MAIVRTVLAVVLCSAVVNACSLCPLRVPPRPRPLNQYKPPPFPEFDSENMPQFCSIAKDLPVEPQCKLGFENIFCAGDTALEKCAGPEDAEECSACAHRWDKSRWILKWFDSLGKPGAGISDGNYYWLGDYETCQDLRVSKDFDGKYCRVTLEVPDSLVEEGCTQTDPLAINIGVCFPSACSAETLANLSRSISPYPLEVECEFNVNWATGAHIILILSLIWVLFLIVVTVFPLNENQVYLKSIQNSLSISVNAKKALSTKRIQNYVGQSVGQTQLHSLHGVEFFTFMWIITGNVYNYMMPYIENVAFSFNGVSSPGMHLTNNFSYQVDGLFALSALYTTFLLYGKLESWLSVGEVILKRFIRFWPAYVYCVLFMTFVFVGFASGPMWIHTDTVERCESSWWKNILFISNFYDVRSTCVDFGNIISLEAQFFVVLVILIYVARSHYVYAIIGSLIALGVSCILSFLYIYISELPPVPILTAEPISEEKIRGILAVMQFFFYRSPSYLIGFIFGIYMKNNVSQSRRPSQSQHDADAAPLVRSPSIVQKNTTIILILSAISAIFVLFALLPYASKNVGNPFFLALYGALHRPIWAFSLLSFLYLGELGCFSWVTAILSWRIFSPLSKLTWIALIVAEPVILYFFTSLNRPSYATHWSSLYSAISAGFMSYAIAFVIDIFLTRPIRTLFFPEEPIHAGGLQREASSYADRCQPRATDRAVC